MIEDTQMCGKRECTIDGASDRVQKGDKDPAYPLETGFGCHHYAVAAADLIDLHRPGLGRLRKRYGQ